MLGIYAAEPDAFDEEEIALLAEMAKNSRTRISTPRTRRKRNRLQEGQWKSEG